MSDNHNVVDMKGKASQQGPLMPDFWIAQVDLRLNQIEAALTKLEWQVWLILCCIAAVFVLQLTAQFQAG